MADFLTKNNYDFTLSNFVYRGEGNANLVIAHLKDEIVIRFRKRCTKNDLPVDEGYSRVIREVNFSKQVLQKLLGHYVNIPGIIYHDFQNIDILSETIFNLRPKIRLSKSILEPFATKLPDFTLLSTKLHETSILRMKNAPNSTFCVEIKPKQGYICEVDKIFSKCPFCLKQFYKIKAATNLKISNYCPFDLFSGNEHRMRNAILNLIKNPQNNLKIFKNGICCYDQDSSHDHLFQFMKEIFNYDYEKLFTILLIKILLHPFNKEEFLMTKSQLVSNYINANLEINPRIQPNLKNELVLLLNKFCKSCDFYCSTLPQGCVLERILQMQNLHQHGHDIVYAIYKKYCDILCDDFIHENLVNSFKEVRNITENDFKNDYVNKDDQFEPTDSRYFKQDKPSQSELNILQNYLLFSTANDCSIMICFKKIDMWDTKYLDSSNVIELPNGDTFIVTVNISDVDLKSVQCIKRHYKRDNDIMSAVFSTLSRKMK